MSFVLQAEKTMEMELFPVHSQVRWGSKLNAEKQAKQIIEDASGEAQKLLQAARSRAKNLMKAGYQKGMEKAKRRMARDLYMALKVRARAQSETFPALVELASSMAARIIRTELKTRPELIQDICHEVLQAARGANKIFLQVNPKDLCLVEDKKEVFQQQLSANISIEATDSMARGECRAFGDWGEVDAGVKIQLQHLTEAILGEVNGKPEQ